MTTGVHEIRRNLGRRVRGRWEEKRTKKHDTSGENSISRSSRMVPRGCCVGPGWQEKSNILTGRKGGQEGSVVDENSGKNTRTRGFGREICPRALPARAGTHGRPQTFASKWRHSNESWTPREQIPQQKRKCLVGKKGAELITGNAVEAKPERVERTSAWKVSVLGK